MLRWKVYKFVSSSLSSFDWKAFSFFSFALWIHEPAGFMIQLQLDHISFLLIPKLRLAINELSRARTEFFIYGSSKLQDLGLNKKTECCNQIFVIHRSVIKLNKLFVEDLVCWWKTLYEDKVLSLDPSSCLVPSDPISLS